LNKVLVSEEPQACHVPMPILILHDKLSLILCVIHIINHLKYSASLKFTEKRSIGIYWFMFHDK